MKKHIVIAALMLIAGGLMARFHVASQDYYPVVRVLDPEGLTYTAVLDATDDRPQCGQVSRRFIEVLKANCPQCQVILARCENELQGLELATQLGDSTARPLVRMPGVSIAVEGGLAAARVGCEAVAANAVKRGAPSAKCIASASVAPRT